MPYALAVPGLSLFPLEHLRALVERLLEEAARRRRAVALRVRRAERWLAGRRVDLPDLDLIDRRACARALSITASISTMPCMPPGWLCARRGGVLVIAVTPRQRIASGWNISDAKRLAELPSPPGPYGPPSTTVNMSRAVSLPSLVNPTFMRPCSAGRAPPIECSSSRLMRICTGVPRFLRKQRRDDVGDRARSLRSVTAAAVLADEHDVLRLQLQPAHDRHDRLHGALRRQMDVELAVLPVRHRRARLEALMAGVRRHERFVEDERRLLEAGLEVAVLTSSDRCPCPSAGGRHCTHRLRPGSISGPELPERRAADRELASGRIQTLPSTRADSSRLAAARRPDRR